MDLGQTGAQTDLPVRGTLEVPVCDSDGLMDTAEWSDEMITDGGRVREGAVLNQNYPHHQNPQPLRDGPPIGGILALRAQCTLLVD